jgi:hypothetical protein
MTAQPGAMVYTQGFGSRPENVEVPHLDKRAPNTTDFMYPIGKRWIDQVGLNSYELVGITTTGATPSAIWNLLGSDTGALNTLTTDDSTVVTPSAGNINISGASPLSTTGSGSTVTVNLTGTVPVANGGTGLTAVTAHDLMIGNGTSPLTLLAPSATSGVPLISQGASSNPAYGTAVVAGGGTGSTTFTAHGVLIGEGTGPVVATAAGTNGQVLLGSTGADPAFSTLTTSTGVTFTTGAHTLSVDVSTGGFNVNAASTGVALVAQNSYTVTQAAQTSFSLPTTAAVGQMFLVASALGNTSGWIITQGAGQEIWSGTSHTTNGATGTLAGAIHTSVLLMCTVANVEFIVLGNTTGYTFT